MTQALTQTTLATCAHQGRAEAQPLTRQVAIDGSPLLAAADVPLISGCTLPPPAGGPCTTATFATAAARVRLAGQPLVLQTSVALASPTSTPTTVVNTQTRVRAQ